MKSNLIVAKIGIKHPSFMIFSLTNILGKIGHVFICFSILNTCCHKKVFILETTLIEYRSLSFLNHASLYDMYTTIKVFLSNIIVCTHNHIFTQIISIFTSNVYNFNLIYLNKRSVFL